MVAFFAIVLVSTLFLTGQVLAAPVVPMPLKVMMRDVEIEQRAPEPQLLPLHGAIEAYKREDAVEVIARQNDFIPPEVPTKSLDGTPERYRRDLVSRQEEALIPPEVPTKSDGGAIVRYKRTVGKHDLKARQGADFIPPQVPTKSTDGTVERYRREAGDIEVLSLRQVDMDGFEVN